MASGRTRVGCAALLAALSISAGKSAAETEPRPNLLLVSVDTLRADHLGSYGYPLPISPHLDALAARGVLFEDVTTTIGQTGPAFASLFSSRYPISHGARRNGMRMRPDIPVLAELLREHGYSTAAFVSNFVLVDRISGLARGFDHYGAADQHTTGGFESADAAAVTQSVLNWLGTRAGARQVTPVFLWVHYTEPHAPYELQRGCELPPPSADTGGTEDRQRWLYSTEVCFTDRWIGSLLEGVRKYLPPARTIIVFVADHGESLGEHRYWGHGANVNGPNLRIPLILSGPGVPRGVRVDGPVSIIDVLPTLLELLSIANPVGGEGISLVGAWKVPIPPDRPRFAFADRGIVVGEQGSPGGRSGPGYEDPLELSVTVGDRKAVWRLKERETIYYDLATDPRETRPFPKPRYEKPNSPFHQLTRFYREVEKYAPRDLPELSQEDVRLLRELGYVEVEEVEEVEEAIPCTPRLSRRCREQVEARKAGVSALGERERRESAR